MAGQASYVELFDALEYVFDSLISVVNAIRHPLDDGPLCPVLHGSLGKGIKAVSLNVLPPLICTIFRVSRPSQNLQITGDFNSGPGTTPSFRNNASMSCLISLEMLVFKGSFVGVSKE